MPSSSAITSSSFHHLIKNTILARKMGDNYAELDLDEVNVLELCRLLLDKNIKSRRFIKSHGDEGLEGSFLRRFVIFISIVFIKVLKLMSGLIELLGSFIESFLNLWWQYDSFYKLLLNTLRGKNVELNQESPNFMSVVGLLDTRVELDEKIHHEDPRYNCALAIMAAKTAYENKARVKKIVQDHWKMEYLGFYNCSNAFQKETMTEKKRPTQAFIFNDKTGDHELICVSFRGTSLFSADDLCTDLDLLWFPLRGIGKVHLGFMKALGLQMNEKGQPWWPKEIEQDKHNDNSFAYYKIRQVLREKLNGNKNARFMVTGHSLGGALAVLFPAVLGFHNETDLLEKLEGVYTFGQPRVGDMSFCMFMEKLLGTKRYFRFVYAYDIVPRIPFDRSDSSFKHFGYCYYFNSFYNGQVIKEVPYKNYFSIKSIIPIFLNAVFEMVRSFVLPFAYGSNYKEGIFLLKIRVLGLMFPGLSAHCPQDYVNLTRLGSPETFYALQ